MNLSLREIIAELKVALAGSEADYTAIPLGRAVLLLAIPMILELLMESAFAIADIYFVGKLGAQAVAIVGITETYLFLLYSVAMGLAVGETAVVARRVGEKDGNAAATATIQSIILGIVFSLPFVFSGIFFAEDLLSLMGVSSQDMPKSVGYTTWMLGGSIVIMMLFVGNAIFRGAGDAAIAMKVLIIANSLNIILDPILIFGIGPIPAFGLEGAAYATVIGRCTAVIIQLFLLFKGSKHLRILREHFVIKWIVLKKILLTSSGGIAQMIIAMTSWIFLMKILTEFGSNVVAGATIALRVMMFTMLPAWGLSNAVATLVGQNLGAGHPERAEKSVWVTGFWNMGFLISVSIAYFFFGQELIGIFSSEIEVQQVGAQWLRIVSYSYFIYAWWMVSSQAFNGAGDTLTPTKINFVFFWLVQIPLAWYLAINMNFQAEGVFWSVMISETLVGLITFLLFIRGSWKHYTV